MKEKRSTGKAPILCSIGTWALAAALLSSGCGGDSAPKAGTFTVALLMKAKTNPFFQAMEEGARKAAEELGVELICMGITRETDVEQQINQIENMIAQRVDALLVTPADSKAIVGALLKAQKKGIHVINVDNRLDPDTVRERGLKLAAYVGADNEKGGYLAGTHLMKVLREKKPSQSVWRVAMLEGIRGVDNAEARKRGFLKAVAEDPSFRLVDSQTANWAMEQAVSVFADMLKAHENLDGLFCANDMMALGAIRALKEQGKEGEVVVVSYDNLEAARLELIKGTLAGTVEQHPEIMGEKAVRQAVTLLRGGTIPAETLVPLEVITADKLQKSTKGG